MWTSVAGSADGQVLCLLAWSGSLRCATAKSRFDLLALAFSTKLILPARFGRVRSESSLFSNSQFAGKLTDDNLGTVVQAFDKSLVIDLSSTLLSQTMVIYVELQKYSLSKSKPPEWISLGCVGTAKCYESIARVTSIIAVDRDAYIVKSRGMFNQIKLI